MRGGGGIILALIVASVVALLFADLALKATHQFERHVPSRSENIELSGIGAPSNRWGGDLKGRGHPSRHAKATSHIAHDGEQI
jgi:hypothetical protein